MVELEEEVSFMEPNPTHPGSDQPNNLAQPPVMDVKPPVLAQPPHEAGHSTLGPVPAAEEPAKIAPPPKPPQPKSGVGAAIAATVIIVIVLAALAVYAYLKSAR